MTAGISRLRALVLIGALLLGVAGSASARVDVFTVAGLPVTNAPANANIVELDQPARLDKRLSDGLPANEKAAAAMVRQRLSSYKADYGDAYRGLVRAWRLGVKRVPAVVVDREYVVYGQPNVARALAEIGEARRAGGVQRPGDAGRDEATP